MPLVWVLFAVLAANALFFILSVAAPHVRADVWRHLDEIVIPLLEGSAGLSVFWTNHHPSPLLHVIQLLNLKYLDFRLDYDAYLGFSFQIITTFLLVRAISNGAQNSRRPFRFFYTSGLMLVIAIQFGFNTLEQYTWPLVTTVQYLYFFGIVVYLSVDRCLRQPSGARYLLLTAAALVLIFANASYGTIFLVSMIGALALVFVIERRAVYVRIALLLGLVWSGYYLALYLVAPEVPYAPSQSVIGVLKHYLGQPVSVLTQYALAILAGLVNAAALKDALPATEPLIVFAAWALMLSVVAVFVVFLRKRLYRVTVVPLALMLVSAAFAGPALITRFIWIANDPWGLTQPRYATTFKFVIIGAAWAVLLIAGASASPSRSWRRRTVAAVASVAIGGVLVLQGIQIYSGWKMAPELVLNNRRDELAIFHAAGRPPNTTGLPFRVTGYGGVRGALAYLHENDLNVFADNFPGEPAVREQVRARRGFISSGTVLARLSPTVPEDGIEAGDTAHHVKTSATRQGIKIQNDAAEPLFLRVRVRSPRHLDEGLVLSALSDKPAPLSPGLLRGQQDLYFQLGGLDTLVVATRKPATTVEIELRR